MIPIRVDTREVGSEVSRQKVYKRIRDKRGESCERDYTFSYKRVQDRNLEKSEFTGVV